MKLNEIEPEKRKKRYKGYKKGYRRKFSNVQKIKP